MRSVGILQTLALLIAATWLEVSGDAVVRIALRNYAGVTGIRVGLFALGAAFLFGYGTFLNLAPLQVSTSRRCFWSGRSSTSSSSGRSRHFPS